MQTKQAPPATIDEYISQTPADMQPILNQLRATIKAAAPQAEERISYGMPGFFLNGALVWFALNKRHIGLYPKTPAIEAALKEELEPHQGTKGSLHFPLNKPVPFDLIARIVKVRVEENLKK